MSLPTSVSLSITHYKHTTMSKTRFYHTLQRENQFNRRIVPKQRNYIYRTINQVKLNPNNPLHQVVRTGRAKITAVFKFIKHNMRKLY